MRMEMMMMIPKFCKLCGKQFASGKALGGHMRSHLAPLPVPPKTPPQNQDSGDLSRSADRGIIRSKRARGLFVEEDDDGDETESGSLCDEENGAWCLLLLSNGVWGGSDDCPAEKQGRKRPKIKEDFRCEICDRVFKCSQALGSHRTVHRNKMKAAAAAADDGGGHRVHECPFCGKVFGSGQALGGHKRSHAFGSSSGSCSSELEESLVESIQDSDQMVLMDLNFPAPAAGY
ncbi:unnamed protein product [Cuscuta campestris]|uniref:C2H2-type domain-containing protein n=1 Tax=Cuscuta campestris TaxID=132261 RepID=A0A484NM73_9ASTE|nr:unnamed protein product [Cuscuta campestris]